MQEDSLHIDDAINTFVHVHRAITRDQIMKRVNKKCKEMTSAPPKKDHQKKDQHHRKNHNNRQLDKQL